MTKLYKYYQTLGSTVWNVSHADADFDKIEPEFVTVLALDSIIDENPTREELEAVKYIGPMYFDLDNEDDIAESIKDTNKLVDKLLEHDLQASDMDIYLSGKKGLHVVIDQCVFLPKATLRTKLPAIYKEMAYNFVVESLDMKVYSARKGRMFRTTYNVRANGLRKVPITLEELRNLTAESYAELASAPRKVRMSVPVYRAKMALVYEAAEQKVDKAKRHKSKPVDQQTLRLATPDVQELLNGNAKEGAGFNKIAMQLALYARESNWSEDKLATEAAGLCDKWVSDGRYNTPRRRAAELRRMFHYLTENSSYEFSLSALRSFLPDKSEELADTWVDEEGKQQTVEETPSLGAVRTNGRYYYSPKEDGETPISDFSFKNPERILSLSGGPMRGLSAELNGRRINLSVESTGSAKTLHDTVAGYGFSFTGTDNHAKGVFQIMMRTVGKNVFEIGSEGLNLLQFNNVGLPHLEGKRFLAWADSEGVVQSPSLAQHGLTFRYIQADSVGKEMNSSDLSKAPDAREWVEVPGNKERLLEFVQNLFKANGPETVAKTVGWFVAANYKAILHKHSDKFPLLHVYGPAGLGKTEFTNLLQSLYYYHNEKRETTPNTTPAAFMVNMAASASVPLLLDEWKPHKLPVYKAEEYRAILRDAYNGKTRMKMTQGNTKQMTINKLTLSAPLIFISESPESEPAIVERSVMTAFKRAPAEEMNSSYAAFLKMKADSEPLTVLGKFLVASILASDGEGTLLAQFDNVLNWATKKYTLQPGDDKLYEEGKLDQRSYATKQSTRPRPLYNCSVVMFGLVKFREAVETLLGAELPAELREKLRELMRAAFASLLRDAAISVPEYIKTLKEMALMSYKVDSQGREGLQEGIDYALTEHAGELILVLAADMAYYKYMVYCKTINVQPLFVSAETFTATLCETAAVLRVGDALPKSAGRTLWLRWPELAKFDLPAFKGRLVELNQS